MLTLKLYALRDRLLDYYKQPFLGPGDKTVMASLANMINNEGDSDFVQAPHHFELWTLAEVRKRRSHRSQGIHLRLRRPRSKKSSGPRTRRLHTRNNSSKTHSTA